MKTNFKRIIGFMLAIMIIVSVMVGVNVSVFATEGSETATTAPTEAPSAPVTEVETEVTTAPPTAAPTEAPTKAPTSVPTEDKTEEPTVAPTEDKTDATETPTTELPTLPPDEPADIPTEAPTEKPSAPELAQQKRPKVNTVKGLVATSTATDTIELSWEAVKGATGYIVYIRNSDKTDVFTKQCVAMRTSAVITDLEHTTAYQFKVVAFVHHKGKMIVGKDAYVQTATQTAATSAPSIVRSSTVISFAWSKNVRADGYVVYRASDKTNGEYVEYKKIEDYNTTKFEDTAIENGKAYFYMVKAYHTPYEGDTYYGEGDTLKTVAGLSAPPLVRCTTQLRRVSLEWNHTPLANGYYIYYSTTKEGPFTLMKDTTNNWFNTVRLTTGQQYYFRVVPYRIVGDDIITGTWLAQNKVVTDKAYDKEIGNTYIEISIRQQRMWFYIDGELYVDTPVVTGNVGYYSTPKGAYSIYQKLSPATLTGPTWSSYVDYWMAFTYSGCGIHDASWRSNSEYGGTTYIGNGSHGCVNTPLAKVKMIYSKAEIGTPVVVY